MGNVSVGHEEALVGDRGDFPAACGPSVESDELADDVVIADGEPRLLARILEVLGRCTDRTVTLKAVAGANRRATAEAAERSDLAVGADHDIGLDHRVGADNHPVANFGCGIDDGRGVNLSAHQRSAIADIICASHTSSPSTSARPRIFAKELRLATSSTSKIN